MARLKWDFQGVLICFYLCQGITQLSGDAALSPVLAWKRFKWGISIAVPGNVLFNFNTLNLYSFTWTYKGFPSTTPNFMLLPKMSQVTQFLHSNVIFSRCQKREEYHYELRADPLCVRLLFICTTRGAHEWHLANLTQEDDICLGPKIVRLQQRTSVSFLFQRNQNYPQIKFLNA